MSTISNAQRSNKGLAWSWLKQELIVRLGSDAAGVLLSGYYDRLHQEYLDRARVAAAGELEQLLAQLSDTGDVIERRKLERKIAIRKRRLSGS